MPGLLPPVGTTAHQNATNVSDLNTVMYHYFIHFQRGKANAHTIHVHMTVVTRGTMMTVVEDAVGAAMMKAMAAVVGTMNVDMEGVVAVITIVAIAEVTEEDEITTVVDATMTGGTECSIRLWQSTDMMNSPTTFA